MNQTLHTCKHRCAALGLTGLLLAIAAQAQPTAEASAPTGAAEKTRLQFSPRGLDGVCSQAPLPDLEIEGFWPREVRIRYKSGIKDGRPTRPAELSIKPGLNPEFHSNRRRVVNHIDYHVNHIWRCEGDSGLNIEIRITRAVP